MITHIGNKICTNMSYKRMVCFHYNWNLSNGIQNEMKPKAISKGLNNVKFEDWSLVFVWIFII